MVADGQPLEARAERRLAEDEPDPRRRDGPAVGCSVVAQPGERRRGPVSRQDGGRRSLAQAAQVLAEPCLDRAVAPLSRRWMKPRTLRNAVLEREPRVALAECVPPAAGRAADDPQRRVRAGRRQAAGRQERVEEREPQGGPTGAARRSPSIRSRIAPSPTSWRGVCRSSSASTRRSRAIDEREAGRAARVRIASAPTSRWPRWRSSASSGAWRCSAAAALVAADRAAVVLRADRPRIRAGDRRRLVVDRPDDLVDDEGPAAGRAAGREQVADRRP